MVTLYKPREIDLDLFTNAASKGFQDGAKVPTPFASFVGSFFEGLDDSQKYEAQAQQIEQNQIKIDQAPVENRIREAEAVRKEADAKVIQDNPDLYAQTQVADLKAKAAENQQQAAIQTKKTELLNIWNGDDPAAKGDAVTSGRFDVIFAQDPKIKEQYVKSTYKDWTDDSRKLYDQTQAVEREKKWNLEVTETVAKQNPANEQAFLSNPDIQSLKQQINKQLSDNNTPYQVSDTDILEKGQMVTIQAPPLVPKEITDPKNPKLTISQTDEYGNIVYMPDPSSANKPVERRVFRYDGKQYDLGTGISAETYKVFNNYKTTYDLKNKLTKGSDGITDLNISAQQKKSIEAKNNAEATMQYQNNSAEVKTQQDAFFDGARIDPQYQTAANTVRKQIKESTATPEPALTERDITPTKPAIPDLTPSATPAPVVSPAVMTPETRATPALTPVPAYETKAPIETPVSPAFTVTPGTASPIVKPPALASPTPTVSPLAGSTNPQDQQTLIKQQMAKSKAQQIMSKYQNTNSAVPSSPAPVDQVRETTSSSFVPKKMQVNVPSNYGPNAEAIQRVAANPAVQGLSAMAKALIVQESGGKDNALSPTDVKGLAQVTEATAKGISPDINRTNSVQSALAGAIYLEKLMSDPTFENNPMLAITAYNGGPATVAKAIQLAGSTDWNIAKNFLEPAVLSIKWPKSVDPKQKAKEVRQYAERVVANFPSFVYTRSDMTLADKLKQQNILSF